MSPNPVPQARYAGRNMPADHLGHVHEGEAVVPPGATLKIAQAQVLGRHDPKGTALREPRLTEPLAAMGFDNSRLALNGKPWDAGDAKALADALQKGDAEVKNTGPKQAYIGFRVTVATV